MSEPKPVNPLLVLLLIVLTAFAGYVAVKIEILNAEAGYYLPRTDLSEHGNNKWRVTSDDIVEQYVREELLSDRLGREGRSGMDYDEFKRRASEMELSELEAAEVEREVAKTRANRLLSEAVLSVGCYQHFVVLLGIGVAVSCFRKSRFSLNLFSSVCLLVLLSAGFLMIYRQYLYATVY